MNKSLLGFVFTMGLIPLLFMGTLDADAYIYGYLKDSGVAVGNGQATAERNDFYFKDSVTSPTTGYFWLDSDSGDSYEVESFKGLYDRVQKTASHNTDAGTFTTDNRADDDINIKVVYDADTGVTYNDALDFVTAAEDFYFEEHSINFIYSNDSWGSDDATGADDCGNTLEDMRSDINWSSGNYGSVDMVIGVSDGAFTSGTACMAVGSGSNPPTSGGNHPYMLMDITQSSDEVRSIIHEIAHAYGFDETNVDCDEQVPGIMATNTAGQACNPNYLVNLPPDDDDTIENRKSWY